MKKLIALLLPFVLVCAADYNRYATKDAPPPPLITPPVSPMPPNDFDVTIDADFLWWTTHITHLSYATKYQVISTPRLALVDRIYEFDWSWDPGVRVAIGFNTNHDGWDVTADWTYFYNSFHDSRSVDAPIPTFVSIESNPVGTEVLSNTWSEFSSEVSNGNRISAGGGFQLNQVDLQLGRNFWLSPRLSLRPFGGARGHFSNLDVRSKKTFEGSGASVLVGFGKWNDHYKQEFRSVGILGGFDSSWNIAKFLSIFGSGAFSLVYGPFKNTARFHTLLRDPSRANVIQDTSIKRVHDQIWTYQQVLDLALGIRIENTWINPEFRETFRMMIDIGWEAHIYPSYNHLDQSTSNNSVFGAANTIITPITYLPIKGNLTLSGLIIRGRFEF